MRTLAVISAIVGSTLVLASAETYMAPGSSKVPIDVVDPTTGSHAELKEAVIDNSEVVEQY